MNNDKKQALLNVLENDYFGEAKQEKEEVESLHKILKDVKFFVDVGASIGQYTYYANEFLQNATIVAIEADKLRYSHLVELIDKWSVLSSNTMKAIHAAVSNETGKATFYQTNEVLCGGLHQYWGSSEFPFYENVKPEAVEVECLTLDFLFLQNPPDLIKIDVEGAEYRAVAGAIGILQKKQTAFAVEMHPWGDKSLNKRTSDVFMLFYKFGFDFKRLHKLWYFFPKTSSIPLFPKYYLTCCVMNSQKLRTFAKKVVRVSKNLPANA